MIIIAVVIIFNFACTTNKKQEQSFGKITRHDTAKPMSSRGSRIFFREEAKFLLISYKPYVNTLTQTKHVFIVFNS